MSHHYETHLTWDGNRGDGTATYAGYGREWRITIDGKPELRGSADPSFRGDAARHNPEDLLVAALSSCHLLSYLALCARRGIRVVAYTDHAHGTMELDSRGGGRFTEVVLQPVVTIANPDDLERATALHDEAHALCFIANSCNFPVHHRATIEVQS